MDDIPHFTDEFIKTEHSAVIDGVTSIYETLKVMKYVSESEIIRPPHASLPVQQLLSLGLEAETIALLKHIPYLHIEDEFSLYMHPYSYLEGAIGFEGLDHARTVLWSEDTPLPHDLAPWVIRLSYCRPYPATHGRTIIYDLKTKSITQWANNEQSYTNTYLDLPSMATEEFFNKWLGYLIDLDEMPSMTSSGSRSMDARSPAPPHGYIDYVANGYVEPGEVVTRASEQSAIDGHNKWEAQKKIYREHGWPDDFRGKAFERASLEFMDTFEDKEATWYEARRVGSGDEIEAAAKKLSSFLERSAGEAAIVKNTNFISRKEEAMRSCSYLWDAGNREDSSKRSQQAYDLCYNRSAGLSTFCRFA